MVRQPALDESATAAGPIVYQSKIQMSRIVVLGLSAALAGVAAFLFARNAPEKMVGWVATAMLPMFAFKRRRVLLDTAQNIVAESNRCWLFGKTRKTKLSDYGSISVAVQAGDNDAEDGDFRSLFEVYIVGNGKPPILLFAGQNRPLIEQEVEFLVGRLKWVVGWHARSYGT